MKFRFILALAVAALFISMATSVALAQEDECTEEDCASCRTTNFYYVLIAAIIIFAVFFIWTNRHRVPKQPVEPEKTDEVKK